jgi:hypothetical protein
MYKLFSISVSTFFVLASRMQKYAFKRDKLWQINSTIKEKLNERTNITRILLTRFYKRYALTFPFYKVPKSYVHLRWRKRNTLPEHVRIQISGRVELENVATCVSGAVAADTVRVLYCFVLSVLTSIQKTSSY